MRQGPEPGGEKFYELVVKRLAASPPNGAMPISTAREDQGLDLVHALESLMDVVGAGLEPGEPVFDLLKQRLGDIPLPGDNPIGRDESSQARLALEQASRTSSVSAVWSV
jgi:hypothetical protein